MRHDGVVNHALANAIALAVLAAAAAAQTPPGAAMPSDVATLTATPAPGSPADQRWQLGKQALAAGKLDEARGHLLEALTFHGASPALLVDFLAACGDDQDLLALWTDRWVAAAADRSGKLKIDGALRKQLPAGKAFEKHLAEAQKLVAKRAAALQAVAKFAAKQKPTKGAESAERAVLARWAGELALALGDGAPAILQDAGGPTGAALAAFDVDYEQVFAGLRNLLADTTTAADGGGGPSAAALAAARALLGCQRQLRMPDVLGPFAPEKLVDDAAAAARETLGKALAARAAQRVWSIDELAAMSPDEAEAFTKGHADWSRPGIALSPNGRYRVETICGHETLLGVARTVELHHTRLVSHYGTDPFLSRQGIVRIVPDHTDMETDGSPHWWAGGFQGGDVTTIRFAWGNVPGLGRTLTHELTHRFDGVLRPFLGSWYGEGHANWTAGHYAKMADDRFVEDHLDLGTVANVLNMGYGDKNKLIELLTGKIEEYRDNYPVGYTLYAFLRGHRAKGPQPYREALAAYERNARAGGKDPLAYFTTTFCDGKDGRAASFDAFVTEWQEFLRGVRDWLGGRREDLDWVNDYRALGEGDPAPMVMDQPTWSWAKARVEPFFGQGHAATAARLLAGAGDRAGALAAGLWSLDVDGWRPETAALLRTLLADSKDKSVPGAFAALLRPRFPALAGDAAVPANLLPPVAAYVDALRGRRDALLAGTAAVAAAECDAQASAIDRLLAAPMAASPEGAPPAPRTALGGYGYAETALVGYDKRRVAGLWFAMPDGDLHVGRDKPREGTGAVDAGAASRDAFAHSVAWFGPGAYALRGRVHFTTAYVAGAIVLGHQRRDRNVRLSFTARDFERRNGGGDRRGTLDLRLDAAWERDGNLPGSVGAAQVDLYDGKSWFDYVIYVHGARVRVEIDGELACSYANPDGAPVEGTVGFAVSSGAIRVQQPTVQRLTGRAGDVPGLDLARPSTASLDDLLMLPVRGLPKSEHGTLVLWMPGGERSAPLDNLPRALPQVAKLLRDSREHPQAVVLAMPKSYSDEQRETVRRQCDELRGSPLGVVEHQVTEPLTGHFPFVLFVDADGVLRAGAEIGELTVHSRVAKWARMFRGR